VWLSTRTPSPSPLTPIAASTAAPRRRNVPSCQRASSPFGALEPSTLARLRRSSPRQLNFLLSSTRPAWSFDPSVSPALFYAVSTQGNVITAFNPDAGHYANDQSWHQSHAIALQFQTGKDPHCEFPEHSISIVDSQTFRPRQLSVFATSKICGGHPDITNLAVIADQANNRVICSRCRNINRARKRSPCAGRLTPRALAGDGAF